jgi:hypothetical protein
MNASIKTPAKGFIQTSAGKSSQGLGGYLQVVFVVGEERLWALCPQRLHRVL